MEPFTTWAMINAVLGILLTTTPALVGKKDQLFGFARNLAFCRSSLEYYRGRYVIWLSALGWDDVAKREELKTLLGRDEFDQIQERVDLIGIQARLVLKRLSLDDENEENSMAGLVKRLTKSFQNRSWGPNFRHPAESVRDMDADTSSEVEEGLDGYTKVWREHISEAGGDITRLKPLKYGIMRRVRWVLWREDQLNKCLNLLKTVVTELIGFTDDVIVRKGYNPREIGDALQRQQLVNNADFVSRQLAIHRPALDLQWALVLNFPINDEEQFSNSRVLDPSEMAFSVYQASEKTSQKLQLRKASAEDQRTKSLVAKTLVEVDEVWTTLDDNHETFFQSSPKSENEGVSETPRGEMFRICKEERIRNWTPSLRNLLCACESDEDLAIDLLLERTKLASVLAISVGLLEKTPLFDHLCSCGLRGLVLAESKVGRYFRRSRTEKLHGLANTIEYTFRAHYYGGGPQDTQRCPNHQIVDSDCGSGMTEEKSRRKLYALGIILAELLLGQVVDNLQADPSGKRVPDSESKLLDAVRRNGLNQYSMRQVVQYCLDEATKTGVRNPDDVGAALTWGQRQEFSRRVVKPYWKAIEKHVKDNGGLDIFGRLEESGAIVSELDQRNEHCRCDEKHHSRSLVRDDDRGFLGMYFDHWTHPKT